MPGPTFAEGDVVTLRTVEEEDLELLQRLINDPRVRTGLAATTPTTMAQERDWYETLGDDGVQVLVCVEGDAVGTVSYRRVNPDWGTAELAYFLDPDAWGNGYATDAARTMVAYAFEERRWRKVWARVFETNPASMRVLEKAGFEEEAVLPDQAYLEGSPRDVHRFGLRRADWEGRRSDRS